MLHLHKLLPILLISSTACHSVERISLDQLSTEHRMLLTRADPPTGSETLGFISIHTSGFYLLGFIPMAPATLKDAFSRLAREASDMSATGVSNVQYEIQPPSPFKFSTFPIPDWSASVWLTGQAYQEKGTLEPRKQAALEPDLPSPLRSMGR